MLLGAIADDLTGASDLALTLARGGLKTVQTVGTPPPDFDPGAAEAVVISLKSRTIPAAEAVALSLEAARWLEAAGARQIVFKYCSTFDSTPAGNIGPVMEALAAHLGAGLTLACPAFPANGRTVYRGHLFVGDQLLSESPMKDHPLTPMRDADLVRVLGAQTRLAVGLVGYDVVAAGPEAVRQAFGAAADAGLGAVIVDAVCDDDLRTIAVAARDMRLITGGSGIALGLPENFRRAGLAAAAAPPATLAAPPGRAAILAGSCSAATRRQIGEAIAAGTPAFRIDPLQVADGTQTADDIIAFVTTVADGLPPLVYASAAPEAVAAVQARLGREAAGALVETLLADVARRLVALGFSRLLVAGGETSGAVVGALGLRAFAIGPEIDPGVPWMAARGGGRPLAVALKSGNFGAPDFFLKAWGLLS